jgi:Calponin homology (CH) domain/IQ calmodulin-binding motif
MSGVSFLSPVQQRSDCIHPIESDISAATVHVVHGDNDDDDVNDVLQEQQCQQSQVLVFDTKNAPNHSGPHTWNMTDTPTLHLEQFCQPPVLDFGRCKTGRQRYCPLRIVNESTLAQRLCIDKLPGTSVSKSKSNSSNASNGDDMESDFKFVMTTDTCVIESLPRVSIHADKSCSVWDQVIHSEHKSTGTAAGTGTVLSVKRMIQIPAMSEILIIARWKPTTGAPYDGKNVRESLAFKWNKRFTLRTTVIGCAIAPKHSKSSKSSKTTTLHVSQRLGRRTWNTAKTSSVPMPMPIKMAQDLNASILDHPDLDDDKENISIQHQQQHQQQQQQDVLKPKMSRAKKRVTNKTSTATTGTTTAPARKPYSVKRTLRLKRSKPNKNRATPSLAQTVNPTVLSSAIAAAKDLASTTSTSTTSATATRNTTAATASSAKNRRPSQHRRGLSKTMNLSRITYDEKWADKQERGFKRYLNYMLGQAGKAGGAFAAPTCATTTASDSKHQTNHSSSVKLITRMRTQAALRRQAFALFHSSLIESIVFRIDEEVSVGTMRIRPDRDLYNDIGLRKKVIKMLFDYELQWLTVAIEAVFGRTIETSEAFPTMEQHYNAVASFLHTHLFSDQSIETKHATMELVQTHNPNKPIHRYDAAFLPEMTKHTLKYLLRIFVFLEISKRAQIVPSDPCLFNKDATFKSTADVLVQFAKDFLSAEGDINRHLKLLGCEIVHRQSQLEEFDFTVTNLASDLRDGVRLCKLVELMLQSMIVRAEATAANATATDGLTAFRLSQYVRLPADSRLRKVFNVDLALVALQALGLPIKVRDQCDLMQPVACLTRGASQSRLRSSEPSTTKELHRVVFQSIRSIVHRTNGTVPAPNESSARGSGWPYKAAAIVDGHREKTLALLWHIVLHWDLEHLLDTRSLENEIEFISTHSQAQTGHSRAHRSRNLLAEVRADAKAHASQNMLIVQELYMTSDKLQRLLEWVQCVVFVSLPQFASAHDMDTVHVPVHNFTTSFTDGRVLCLLLHYYHPSLISLSEIDPCMYHQAALEELCKDDPTTAQELLHDRSKWAQFYSFDTMTESAHEQNRTGAKKNLHLFNERAARLDNVPIMIRPADMLNGIPDEKIVLTCVSFLCLRLLSLSKEIHAIRRIQRAWRKHSMRTSMHRAWAKSKASIMEQRAREERERVEREAREEQERLEREAREEKERLEREAHERELAAQRQAALEQNSATAIQHFVRSCLQRRTICASLAMTRQRRLAAICIQSVMRGVFARRRVTTMREMQYRMCVHSTKRAVSMGVNMLFAHMQNVGDRILAETLIRHTNAATQIQAAVRCFQHRRRYVVARQAAVRIQSIVRMQHARVQFMQLRDSTIAMQRRARGMLAVKAAQRELVLLRTQHHAATTLQAAARRLIAQSAYNRMRHTAVALQALVRSKQARRRFTAMRDSVVAIQAAVRMMQARSAYLERRTMVTHAQALVRGYIQRRAYQQTRCATVQLQTWWRCVVARRELAARKVARQQLLNASATTVQAAFQMVHARRQFQSTRACTIRLQAIVRCKQARSRYMTARVGIVALQAAVRRHQAHTRFVALRRAAVAVQCAWRAKMARRHVCQLREEHKQALVHASHVIGTWYTDRCLIRQARSELAHRRAIAQQTRAINVISTAYANLVARRQARAELESLRARMHAVCVLQAWTRSKLQIAAAKQALNKLRIERAAAITIQCFVRMVQAQQKASSIRRARARKLAAICCLQSFMRTAMARNAFVRQRNAATVIQAHVRSVQCQRRFVQLRAATIRMQALARGKQARSLFASLQEAERQRIAAERCAAATKLQGAIRGWIARKMYRAMRVERATIIAQRAFRTKHARESFVELRAATIQCQAIVRGVQARRRVAAMRRANSAACAIQTLYRAFVARREMQVAVARRSFAAKRIQLVFRAYLLNKQYREKLNAVSTIQRFARGFIVRRQLQRMHEAANTIQSAVRASFARVRRRRFVQSVTKFQALWRGFQVRKATSKAIKASRARIAASEAKWTPEQSIGHRTRTALDILLESKRMTTVSQACKTLEVVTGLLEICCVQAVEKRAVPVLFALMQSCNRSTPHLQLVRHCLNTLLNLAKCSLVSRNVFEPENAVDILVEQLQIYRDKDDIFLRIVHLMRIGTCHEGFASYVSGMRDILPRMVSIKRLVSHRVKLQHNLCDRARTAENKAKFASAKKCAMAFKRLLDIIQSA